MASRPSPGAQSVLPSPPRSPLRTPTLGQQRQPPLAVPLAVLRSSSTLCAAHAAAWHKQGSQREFILVSMCASNSYCRSASEGWGRARQMCPGPQGSSSFERMVNMSHRVPQISSCYLANIYHSARHRVVQAVDHRKSLSLSLVAESPALAKPRSPGGGPAHAQPSYHTHNPAIAHTAGNSSPLSTQRGRHTNNICLPFTLVLLSNFTLVVSWLWSSHYLGNSC